MENYTVTYKQIYTLFSNLYEGVLNPPLVNPKFSRNIHVDFAVYCKAMSNLNLTSDKALQYIIYGDYEEDFLQEYKGFILKCIKLTLKSQTLTMNGEYINVLPCLYTKLPNYSIIEDLYGYEDIDITDFVDSYLLTSLSTVKFGEIKDKDAIRKLMQVYLLADKKEVMIWT